MWLEWLVFYTLAAGSAPEAMKWLVHWLPLITLVLKALAALCTFLVSASLLARRIRRWRRRRR